MLDVAGLSITYGKHLALDGVSLTVGRGEIVVMLGANGAGKSSCLKALGGTVPPLPGATMTLGGTDLCRLSPHQVVEAGLALVPEDRGIFADLSVRENLKLGAFTRRAHAQEAENLNRVLGLFPRLGERMGQFARTMSGGERQMLAIGRALMSSPDILLLDEPSLGLSPLVCKELFQALSRIKEMGVGVLLVEQNARQGLAIASRGYLLENGRIVGHGDAAELQQGSGCAPRLSGWRRPHWERTRPLQWRSWHRDQRRHCSRAILQGARAAGKRTPGACTRHTSSVRTRGDAGKVSSIAAASGRDIVTIAKSASWEGSHVRRQFHDQQCRCEGRWWRHLRPAQSYDRRGRLARRRRRRG